MDLISVIVPIYNSEKYLKRCINSILNQTYDKLEIILVNDGSTDNSSSICKIYKSKDPRIKVINKTNGGLSSARNAGLRVATGSYVSFVDSDDWIASDIYEYCLNVYNKFCCDIVDFKCIYTTGEENVEKEDDKIHHEIVEGKEILRDYLYRGQTEKTPFSVCRKLYKKCLFNEIDFPIGKINEDIATNYKVLMKADKLVHIDKIGYFYFQDDFSITRNVLNQRDFNLLDACKELEELTKDEDYKDIRYLAKVKYARSYFSLLAKLAMYGMSNEQWKYSEKEIVNYLTYNLRNNFVLLMMSPMNFNRKILIALMCVNINLVSVPINIFKKFKNKNYL